MCNPASSRGPPRAHADAFALAARAPQRARARTERGTDLRRVPSVLRRRTRARLAPVLPRERVEPRNDGAPLPLSGPAQLDEAVEPAEDRPVNGISQALQRLD